MAGYVYQFSCTDIMNVLVTLSPLRMPVIPMTERTDNAVPIKKKV